MPLQSVEMTKYLLFQPGSERLFLFSERISQDPLENYFGKQRARCDNPIIQECMKNAVGIRAQRSLNLDRVKGNCHHKQRGVDEDNNMVVDDTPLPKCKRHSKK